MRKYDDDRVYAYSYDNEIPILNASKYDSGIDAYSQYEKEYDNPIELPIKGVRVG